MPAELTLPNVKIQSNFTFTMASTGDPSTFTFTMDALPGYTYFNPTKKVLCVIQVVEDAEGATTEIQSVMPHKADEIIEESKEDSASPAPLQTIDVSGLTWVADDGDDLTSLTMDGDFVEVTLDGELPEGVIEIVYADNKATTTGTYTAKANFEVEEGYEAPAEMTQEYTVIA
jgi:hypothetical protein